MDCSIVKIPTTSTILPTTTKEETNDTGVGVAILGGGIFSIPHITTTEDIPIVVASGTLFILRQTQIHPASVLIIEGA